MSKRKKPGPEAPALPDSIEDTAPAANAAFSATGILWAFTFVALVLVPDQKILRYKLLAVEAGVCAVLAALAAGWVTDRRTAWRSTPLDVPVALLGAGALLFYLLSPERGVSAMELTRMLFCAATFFTASQTIPRLRNPEKLIGLWGLLSAPLGIYALLQTRGGLGRLAVPLLERPIATFGNPIFLAAFFTASLAALGGLVWQAGPGRARKLYIFLAVLTAAGLWTTQARASVAGLATAGALATFIGLQGRKRWLGLACVLAGGLASLWLFRGREWTHGLIWRDTLALWLSRPWLGCGLGRFHIEFPTFASEALRALWPERAVIINFAHNEYLQVLAETGIAGLALLLNVLAAAAVWAAKVLRGSQAPTRPLAAGLALGAAALLGQNFFSPDMRFGLSSFMVFFCLGAASGLLAPEPAPEAASPGPKGAVLAAAFLAFWAHLAVRPALAQQRLSREAGFHVEASAELRRLIGDLEGRLASDPVNADVAETLGYLYSREKSWPQAVARFELSSQLDPLRPGPLNNLGNIYYSTGDLQRAIAYWTESVRVKPEQADAHLNLGKALYEVGRLKESSEHLHAVLTRDPGNEKAQVLLKKMVE